MFIFIEVLDANDNAPEFVGLPTQLSIEENRNRVDFYRLQAIDRDARNFGSIEYSVEDADGMFVVNPQVRITLRLCKNVLKNI